MSGSRWLWPTPKHDGVLRTLRTHTPVCVCLEESDNTRGVFVAPIGWFSSAPIGPPPGLALSEDVAQNPTVFGKLLRREAPIRELSRRSACATTLENLSNLGERPLAPATRVSVCDGDQHHSGSSRDDRRQTTDVRAQVRRRGVPGVSEHQTMCV